MYRKNTDVGMAIVYSNASPNSHPRYSSKIWTFHIPDAPSMVYIYTPGSSNIARWKMDPDWADVFPIRNGDIPASYVSVPEGTNTWI